MKAVLGAAVAALVVGLSVGWTGNAVLADRRAPAILLGDMTHDFKLEGTNVYIRHFRRAHTFVVGAWDFVEPLQPGMYPAILVPAEAACYVRFHPPQRHTTHQEYFDAHVDVFEPAVVGFKLEWRPYETGDRFLFWDRQGRSVKLDASGATIRPDWCD